MVRVFTTIRRGRVVHQIAPPRCAVSIGRDGRVRREMVVCRVAIMKLSPKKATSSRPCPQPSLNTANLARKARAHFGRVPAAAGLVVFGEAKSAATPHKLLFSSFPAAKNLLSPICPTPDTYKKAPARPAGPRRAAVRAG